jgi:hypothetical protein
MAYGSFYEITNPLTTVARSHFVDWFVNNSSDVPRNFHKHDVAGSNSIAQDNEIDGGLKLITGTGASNNIQIDFNNNRPFAHNHAKTIGVIQKESTENCFMDGGFKDGYGDDNNQLSFCHIEEYSSIDGIFLQTGSTTTTTGADANALIRWHTYEIELTPSNNTLKLDGMLKATSTTNCPTSKLQPAFKCLTRVGSSKVGKVKYCEAWNT